MNRTILFSLVFSQVIFFNLLPVWMELTKYLHTIVIVVVWFLITLLSLFAFCWIKKEEIRLSKRFLHFMTLLYAIGLLILLFFRPQGANYGAVNFIPFETIAFYLSGRVDFLVALYNLGANIGLFVPFGLYFRYVMKSPSLKQLLLLTVCSISLIEWVQFLSKRGSLDIDDLLLNIVGVCFGYFLYPIFRRVFVIK